MNINLNEAPNYMTNNWRFLILRKNEKILKCIEVLNAYQLKIVIVVDEFGRLIGSVTDGDVRRGILRGIQLEDDLSKIVNESPKFVNSSCSIPDVIHLMSKTNLHQIPVVDSENIPCGLYVWDQLIKTTPKPNYMVVMVGGMGNRLRPITNSIPKPMVQVSGKPMLEHIILQAKKSGILNFVFVTHYLSSVIKDYFLDGMKWGVSIQYIEEIKPLGTAGGLSELRKRVEFDSNIPIVITNGDVLTRINYSNMLDFHRLNKAVATMAVKQHELVHQFGVIKLSGINIIDIQEKPSYFEYINAGIYVLDSLALDYLDGDYCDMTTLFDFLRAQQFKTIAYPIHEEWFDVGRPEDLGLNFF